MLCLCSGVALFFTDLHKKKRQPLAPSQLTILCFAQPLVPVP